MRHCLKELVRKTFTTLLSCCATQLLKSANTKEREEGKENIRNCICGMH